MIPSDELERLFSQYMNGWGLEPIPSVKVRRGVEGVVYGWYLHPEQDTAVLYDGPRVWIA